MTTYFITLNDRTEKVEITDMDGNIEWQITHPRDVMFFMGSVMKDNDTLFKSSSMDFPTEYTSNQDVLDLVAQIETKIFA